MSRLVTCRHCGHTFRLDPPWWKGNQIRQEPHDGGDWSLACRRCRHAVEEPPPPGGWLPFAPDPPPTWTGPRPTDWNDEFRLALRAPVPPERWPYGPPDHHELFCALRRLGLWCDCLASESGDVEYGVAS